MAFNFDSEQFNREKTPRHLGNCEVPRWAPTKPRRLECRPDPKPICDNNGHFLPGVPKGISKCFGHYTGTWDLPNKITRKVAAELQKEPPPGRFLDWVNIRVQRPHAAAQAAAAARKRARERGKPPKVIRPVPDPAKFEETKTNNSEAELDKLDGNKQQDQVGQEQNDGQNQSKDVDDPKDIDDDDPLDLYKKKEPVDSEGHGPYVPGSLTDPDQRHESYDLLVKDAVEKVHGPQEDETERFWRKVAENAKKNEEIRQDMKEAGKSEKTILPQVDVTKNFLFAKQMHVGNLEHQPLPDTLGYRKLTTIGEHRDSDIVVKPYAIAWKGYGATGPTCCTKMRVHRPKSCDTNKVDAEKMDAKRPQTSAPDIGGDYKKPMTLMDLAICWDFGADDPKKEPRRPKHIDGSNGSKAPAVFTMIKTPKEEDIENAMRAHTNPIFVQNRAVVDDVGRHPVPYFEKDMTQEKRSDTCEVQHCPQHSTESTKHSKNSSRKNSAHKATNSQCDGIHGCGTPSGSRKSSHDSRPEKLDPIKEAWSGNGNSKAKNNCDSNTTEKRNSLDSYEKTSLAQGKLHQSSPSESHVSKRTSKDESANLNNNAKHKSCISCSGTKMPQHTKQKEDYKFAFKAGNPNSVQSSNASHDSKDLKIPKMRHPYTKKSYTIPTLAPPFSIWRDSNATGYPEHWRLASVYQHAYKPLEQRRKPLLSSVYQ